MKYLNTIIILLFSLALTAQTTFTNSTAALGLTGYHSGVAIAVTDINGDGLDDIAHLQEGRDLYIEYQQTDGSFVQVFAGNMASGSEWSICVGDVDNNGISDAFTGGAYNGVKLATANADGSDFNIGVLPGPSIFMQGSNFVDINNDGWIDIFACNDDGESRIWGNDGAGNFTQSDNWIDMATTPTSDNSGNYGSVWCDFDNDGDSDLYIAKCRSGVSDSSDPRRINVLYENDGNGNFTENADAYGLKIGAQSWTADFADYDNDGDFDCFITNHDVPSQLLRNDNGYFNDVTSTSGINVNVTPIQAIMEDFDNDGYVDLLVSGGDEQFFHNDGDGTFTEMNLFDNEDMESFGIGDLNHDGFLDIYGGYAGIYTNPSNVDDAVWLNDGNNNNYIAVNLEGTVSNRDAIGAKVEIHGDWGIQIREVRAGEGYGIVNSKSQHFGIGQNTSIDQLIIKWPSGIIDIIDNPAINEFITVTENNCVTPIVNITTNGDSVLCLGASLDLTATAGFSYQWSTGETTQNITISQAGTYDLTITDDNNCSGYTSISIQVAPDETPSVIAEGDLDFCEGGSVTLTSSEANSYTWSTGETSQSITVSEAGNYLVTTTGTCSDFSSEEITVTIITAPRPIAQDVTIEGEQAVTLDAIGNDLTWYDAPTGGNILGTGTSYTTPVLNADVTYYVEDNYEYGEEEFDAGSTEHAGSEFSGGQYNGQIIFDALDGFTLKTVKVYSGTPGERIIELRDNSGAVIESATVNITASEEVITLDFEIIAGTGYILTTNEANNNNVFGQNSPQLKRSDSDVDYPYTVDDLVKINDSNYGDQFYYYFYDWKIESTANKFCKSERTAVFVDFNFASGINNIDASNQIKMYPNPTSGLINLEINLTSLADIHVSILDITGKEMKQISLGKSTRGKTIKGLDLSGLSKGIYTIKINADKDVYVGKIVLQ